MDGGWELNMGAGCRRQDAFAADFLACKGDAESRKALESVGEREADHEAGAAASVLCLPKCHCLIHTVGHCCSANAGSLTCFSEQ